MKRKFYKESFIALAVVLFFDFFRLFYVINLGVLNIFDFMWMILLIALVFFTYISNDESKRHVTIICLVLGILPILFVVLNLIQIVSTGISPDFDFYFMLFEGILIAGINVLYFIEFMKYIKSDTNSNNNE